MQIISPFYGIIYRLKGKKLNKTRFAFVCAMIAACISFSGCSDPKPVNVYTGVTIIDITEEAPVVSEETADVGTETTDAIGLPVVQTKDSAESAETTETVQTQTATVESNETPENIEIFIPEDVPAGKPLDFTLQDGDLDFLEHSVFVGDSICKGFGYYGFVDNDKVYGVASLAARSFFDYSFKYGPDDKEIGFVELLKHTKPEILFLSMGMNDVNMTTEKRFCENYKKIIDLALENSDAEIYICAITPVNGKFTANSVINSFNDTLKQFLSETYTERVRYVDFGQHLRSVNGKLLDIHNAGDGVHIMPSAYKIAMWELARVTKQDGLR